MKNIQILAHFSDGSVLPIERDTGRELINALIGVWPGAPPTKLEIETISDEGEVWISIPFSQSEEVGFGVIMEDNSEPIYYPVPDEVVVPEDKLDPDGKLRH